MAHVLILGQTLSGKSMLAKRLAAQYRANNISTIVLDPVGDPEWHANFSCANPDQFFQVYNESRQCAAFFDESGEVCESHKSQIVKTATRGRHRGHRNHYIAQRATLIHRTIRDQCSELFLFNSGLEDCKIHAAEWNCPQLKEKGPFLKTGEYFHKTRMGDVTFGNLFK